MNRVIEASDVANVIPIGYENAMPLALVTQKFESLGWLDNTKDKFRLTRRMIERAGYEYTICNLQDGHGYFRPTKDDMVAFRKYIHQEEARLQKISKRLKVGRALFEDFMKDRCEEQKVGV